MNLPWRGEAVTEQVELAAFEMKVDPEKLIGYLLSDSHPLGQRKARHFRALGFRAETPLELEEALIVHARENPLASREETQFWSNYVVDGPFRDRRSPSGEPVELRSVWFVEAGAVVARFVTAYPIGRGRL